MHGHDPVNRLYGIYPGIVHENLDPENRLRLRVKVPAVLGDAVLGWAPPCVPNTYAKTSWTLVLGVETLLSTTPAIGSKVWVMFIAGDPDHPVWVGTS